MRKPGDLAAEGIEHAPVRIATIDNIVEINALAGRSRELVNIGFVGRLESSIDPAVERKRCGFGQVEQPKTVGTCSIPRPVNTQLVVARHQVHGHRAIAKVDGIGLGESTVGYHVAARTTQ